MDHEQLYQRRIPLGILRRFLPEIIDGLPRIFLSILSIAP